jgi:hypothetical protein
MKLHPSRALLGIIYLLPFGLALASTAHGAVEIELVQVPASEAASASSLEARIRPLTLSEQFAATRVGALTASPSDEAIGQPGSKVTIYECGELLANATDSPDRAALVIELARRKAYLMIDGMMVLETPIAVNGSGTEVPLGWQPISARTQNTPVSNLYEFKPPFWLKLGDSGFGIHAGDLTGYPSSGGCVRLPQRAIDTVFRHAPPGTMVYICSTWLAPVPTSSTPAAVAIADEAPEEPSPPRLSETPPLKISAQESSPKGVEPSPLTEVAAVAAVQPATPERASEPPKAAPKAIPEVAKPPSSRPVEEEPEPEVTLPGPKLADSMPPTTPPADSAPASASPTPGHQVTRVRHLLGGFSENPDAPSKSLTPVSGRSVAKPAKAPTRPPGQVEVLTFRSLLSGGASRQSSR